MKQLTQDILLQDILGEKQIRLLCRRMNVGEKINIEKEYLLTPEQVKKGIAWLYNLWKTPKGIEKKNNPFGYREMNVIEEGKYFTFDGFFDTGNNNHTPIFVPIYTLHSQKESFQYVVVGGKIQIIG